MLVGEFDVPMGVGMDEGTWESFACDKSVVTGEDSEPEINGEVVGMPVSMPSGREVLAEFNKHVL